MKQVKKINDRYAHLPKLSDQQINDILRLCHRSLEQHMQMEFTDEQFLQIFTIWRKYTPIQAYSFTPIANSVHYNKLFSEALCKHYHIKNVGSCNKLAWKLKQWLDADFQTAQQYWNIILHIPHAGTEIMPEAVGYVKSLKKASQYQVDYFTDELFAGAITDELKKKITPIIFPYNRLLCDVERLPNDPLEEKYKGIIRGSHGYTADFLTLMDVHFLYKYYVDHHAQLANAIIDAHLDCLLLDCHSFSCVKNPLLPKAEKYKDVDICIGYNDDKTQPPMLIINTIQHYFVEKGYRVSINSPFSNSKTIDLPNNCTKYHSLMIEVNKSLYMNEESLEKTEGFVKLQKDIQEMYKLILK